MSYYSHLENDFIRRTGQLIRRAGDWRGDAQLTHEISFRWLEWLCGQGWAQRRWWPGEAA